MSTSGPRVLLRSEETGGQVALIELDSSPERGGPKQRLGCGFFGWRCASAAGGGAAR